MDTLVSVPPRTTYEFNQFDSSFSIHNNPAAALPTTTTTTAATTSANNTINNNTTTTANNHPGHGQQSTISPTTQFSSAPLPLLSTTSLQDFRTDFVADPSQPTSGPSNTSSPMYSPPGLSVSTSVSAASEVVSPPGAALPSPARRGSTDTNAYSSPLDGSTEWAHIAIPPLYPPTVQWPDHDFEDWDSLPELLRQEPRADFTPRRPMNAYFIYMRIRRAQFANANPHLSTGDLSKILGKEWGALPADKKEPWSELYERLMRAFKKKYPDYQYERGGKRSKKRRSRSDPPHPGALRLVNIPRTAMVHPGPHSAVHTSHHSPRYLPYPHPGQGIFYAQQQQHLQQMQMQQHQMPPPSGHPQQQAPYYRSEQMVQYSPTYTPATYQPMHEPQPLPVDPQMYMHQPPQQQYQWHQAPEPLPAPTPSYTAEPTWDEYMH